jgi:hypothetical protein
MEEADKGTITEEVGSLRQENQREDDMRGAKGYAEMDADVKASEEGQRRLRELEKELRVAEEQRLQEKARVRAEELKKRSQEPERVIVSQVQEVVQSVSDKSSEPKLPSESESSKVYLEVLQLAYRDGTLDKNEAAILALLRQRFGLTEEEHLRMQQRVQQEIYSQAMIDVWQAGVATQQDFDRLDLLREHLNISAEDHLRLERQVRRQALQRMAAGNPS